MRHCRLILVGRFARNGVGMGRILRQYPAVRNSFLLGITASASADGGLSRVSGNDYCGVTDHAVDMEIITH